MVPRTPQPMIGAFGVVSPCGDGRVCKTVRCDTVEVRRMALREYRILHDLVRHPNVVQVFGCEDDWRNGLVHILMEHGGPDLLVREVRGDECEAVERQLSDALAHLHSRSIAHRDLKLDNVVMNDTGHVRLIDFGLAIVVPDDVSHTAFLKGAVGSRSYMAPEVWTDTYDPFPADIWALGVVLYCIVFRALPFSVADPARDSTFQTWLDAPGTPTDSLFQLHGEAAVPPHEWMREALDRRLRPDPAARRM